MTRREGKSHSSTRGARLTKASGRFSTSSLLTGARIAGALAGFVTQVVLARMWSRAPVPAPESGVS